MSIRSLGNPNVRYDAKWLTSGSIDQPGLPVYNWFNTLTGSVGADRWYTGMLTPDNEFMYFAGTTKDGEPGHQDGFVGKFDKEGLCQWQQAWGSNGVNENYTGGCVVDSSGNVYAHGYQTYNYYATLVKYNSSGTVQFEKQFYPTGYGCLAGGTAVDGDDIYCCGYVTSTQGAYLAKFNTSGVVQWTRKLTGASSNNAEGNDVTVDSGGNPIMVGHADGNWWVAKYNSSGTIQWKRQFDVSANCSPGAVITDSDDNVIVSGADNTNGHLGVAKWNSSGTIQWQRKIEGISDPDGLCVDKSDNIYVGGQETSGTKGFWAKWDSSGTNLLQRTLNSSGSETIRGGMIDDTSDRGGGVSVIFSGWTDLGSDSALVLKFPSDGSGTGTYGDWTYASASLTEAATTATEGAFGGTDSALTMNVGDQSRTTTVTDCVSSTTVIS